MTNVQRHQYHTLDGMRGIAALLIVLFHTSNYFAGLFFPESYLAVDLFFVLSGFVIAKAYTQRLDEGVSTYSFIRIRLIRLYPLYAMGTLLGIILAIASVIAGSNVANWSITTLLLTSILAMLVLPSPLTPQLYAINAPSWSLLFELLANALYAMFYRLLSIKKLILITCLAAIGLSICAVKFGHLDLGYQWSSAVGGIPRVTYSFCMGLLIAAYRDQSPCLRLPSWCVLALCISLLCISPTANLRPLYDLATILFLFPILVLIGSRSESDKKWIKTSYATLGSISYGLYVLHVPAALLIDIACKKLLRKEFAAYAPISGIILLLTLVLIIWWLDRVYDQPIRKKLTQLLKY
ncbi:acyltransferase family protein [Undibacterium sp. Rencai35W]|uniref:acyltransferase family protein n=1 Tax=Undibacterium sp. Rencai35W TaxID=3413046 RepID=UPI003BF38C43